jgi:TRAP-type C4-dicarboxylate transport system permease small subunit
MTRLIRCIEFLSTVISGDFSGLLVFGMMGIVVIEVVTRYVLHFPLTVADETGGYLLVAVAFLGLAFTWKERAHIRISFITDKLHEGIRRKLRLLTLVVATIFVTVLIYASFELFDYSYIMHIRSPGLRIPLALPQLALLIGSFLLLLQLMAELLKALRSVKKSLSEK